MKQNVKFDFSMFETMNESAQGMLVGGFSVAMSNSITQDPLSDVTNNCSGGNCVAGCATNKTICIS